MSNVPRITARLMAGLAGLTLFASGSMAARPALPSTAVDAKPKSPQAAVYVMVELSSTPTAVQYAQQKSTGVALATKAAVDQLSVVRNEQASFAQALAAAKLPAIHEIYRLQRVFNGILYRTPASNIAALKQMAGVKAVHPVTPQVADNSRNIPFIGASQLWASAGLNVHGEGIKVGVIDTGIDYTHANFGGAGTVAAYTANNPNVVEGGSFPTAKVVGGHDFAGAAYNASSNDPAINTPVPDDDPIDESGHGSHVAGTIAGFGVNADGSTYTGTYDATLDPSSMRIGPGAAPKALLYALKVFGDNGGSTNLAAQAMEWAVDPNGDGDFSDHLDVVNLSLGSSYGTSNDSDAAIYANAVKAGVIVVAAAGNAGDFYFITGAPASTPEVISVAATSTGNYPAPGALMVNSPADIAGLKKISTAVYGPGVPTPITNDVVLVTPNNGCSAITNASAVAGKIAIVNRGTCTFKTKTLNAQNAGAIAVVIANNQAGLIGMADDATITTPITIPTRMVLQTDGNAIKTDLAAGAVNITLDDSLAFVDQTEVDEVATFSSRGPSRLRNHALLKPDLAAPGVNTVSTGMGTGNQAATMSGTSMATPLTAGMMALLRQIHPTWTPAQLKALAMNTADHDTYTQPTTVATRSRVGAGRVGAGRIDALLAGSQSVIAYDKDHPERVSVTFETLDVAAPVTETRTVQVTNAGSADVTYDVTVDTLVGATGGASVTAGATSVTVPAGGAVNVPVTLQADPATLNRTRDATVSSGSLGLPRNWMSETNGYVVFTPQGGGTAIRVPFYAALNPASAVASTGALSTHGAPSGTATLYLQGAGSIGTAVPPFGVTPLVTPMELAYRGFIYNPDETNFGNLHYVGVTSNKADLGSVASSEIYFGVSTYGLWGAANEITFQVMIKAAGAPNWQYALFNSEAGATSSNPGTDLQLTAVVPLDAQGNAAGSASLEDFVNGIAPNAYSVPTLLSDTMMLPVFAADVGLTDTAAGIDYQVLTFSNLSGALIDATPILHYDVAHPAFATHEDSSLATQIGAGGPPMWTDLPGNTIAVDYDTTRDGTNPASGMLLLHHNNAMGMRAEAVPVVKAQSLDKVLMLAAGSTCSAGGIDVQTGFDDNNNGVLDDAEVTSDQVICNGTQGQQGPPGATGPGGAQGPAGTPGAVGPKGGCQSFGGGASFLTLLGLFAMSLRRRRRTA